MSHSDAEQNTLSGRVASRAILDYDRYMVPAANKSMKSAVLVSTPWAMYGRPSIQLGALKAYLKVEFADREVETRPFYLHVAEQIGYDLYRAISERTWTAEAVYAALLFPERKKYAEKIFYKQAAAAPALADVRFDRLIDLVKSISDTLIEKTPWNRFVVAGFSICFCQLASSLYFIRRIKQTVPDLPVVAGGSTLSGIPIQGFLDAFPEIDWIVDGEGERPLAELIRNLQGDPRGLPVRSIPGLRSKGAAECDSRLRFSQVSNLDLLPIPDYDDYFKMLFSFPPDKRFFPTLPMEMSRGCWWRHHQGPGGGCTFCNLNLQWEGYRSKPASRIAAEIDTLTCRYRILSVAFMDNVMPTKNAEGIFRQISKLKKDLKLFGEIRATTPRRLLEAMKSAGIDEIQIGIEALSTRLLKKLNKGSTAIQNLRIMRDCEALGITHNSNLILQFPESDEQDVSETLRTLAFAEPFRPLRCVQFWLGLESPIWQNHRKYGIRSVSNHPHYRALFPEQIGNAVSFMIQAYRGNRTRQKKLWKPVKEKVIRWKKRYEALHGGSTWEPILSFRDGGTFMIIRQRRPDGVPLTHRLAGISRQIYLFCRSPRSMKQISERFSGQREEKLKHFLRMMVDKKLMYEESGNHLSLAVSVTHAGAEP